MCIDLADGPEPSGGRPALADVVFKRSLDRDLAPEDLRPRLHPYGLSYRCRSGLEGLMIGQSIRSVPTAAAPIETREQSPRDRVKQALWPLLQPLYLDRVRRRPMVNIPGIPRLMSQFEAPPSEPAQPLVLLQTRTWPKTQSTHDHRDVTNDQRVELIRTLRRRLGDRFRGGLRPGHQARRDFPDEVTDLPADPIAYLSLVRQCAIVVSTPGLFASNQAQLAESMAASRAVVTMPLAYEIPRTLVDGDEVSEFTDPEGCADACERLLDAPDLLQHRRERAWAYYNAEVRPDVLMRNRLLELASL